MRENPGGAPPCRYRGEAAPPMPTRRILEVAVVAALLMRPIFGLLHVWSAKTLGTTSPGSVAHGAAEVVAVVV